MDECYKVRVGKKPVALIFNNNKFRCMSERTGSYRDVENLKVLLGGLGFDVKTFQDFTASDMKKELLAGKTFFC